MAYSVAKYSDSQWGIYSNRARRFVGSGGPKKIIEKRCAMLNKGK